MWPYCLAHVPSPSTTPSRFVSRPLSRFVSRLLPHHCVPIELSKEKSGLWSPELYPVCDQLERRQFYGSYTGGNGSKSAKRNTWRPAMAALECSSHAAKHRYVSGLDGCVLGTVEDLPWARKVVVPIGTKIFSLATPLHSPVPVLLTKCRTPRLST